MTETTRPGQTASCLTGSLIFICCGAAGSAAATGVNARTMAATFDERLIVPRLVASGTALASDISQTVQSIAIGHSLPSGRYALLGPVFHRLDRTSLRLAHSFDSFVGAREQRWRHIEPDYLRYLEIGDEIKPCGLRDRQIGRLGALQEGEGP